MRRSANRDSARSSYVSPIPMRMPEVKGTEERLYVLKNPQPDGGLLVR